MLGELTAFPVLPNWLWRGCLFYSYGILFSVVQLRADQSLQWINATAVGNVLIDIPRDRYGSWVTTLLHAVMVVLQKSRPLAAHVGGASLATKGGDYDLPGACTDWQMTPYSVKFNCTCVDVELFLTSDWSKTDADSALPRYDALYDVTCQQTTQVDRYWYYIGCYIYIIFFTCCVILFTSSPSLDDYLKHFFWVLNVCSGLEEFSIVSALVLKYAVYFLCVKVATALVHLSHRNSVCLSVCLSHGWISQKRCKLGSPNFYYRLPERL